MSFELSHGEVSALSGTPLKVISDEREWSRLRQLFRLGELVLVHAGPVPKGISPYKGPLKVEKVLGHYTFHLSDGQRWSARHMKQWYEPPQATYLEPMVIEPEEPQMLRRSPRVNIGIPPIRYRP